MGPLPLLGVASAVAAKRSLARRFVIARRFALNAGGGERPEKLSYCTLPRAATFQ